MSKFHSKPTTLDGYRFDSMAEARRYGELKLLERAGEITSLELQPKFEIVVEDAHICYYFADFIYWDNATDKWVVEDVKGVRTAVYKLKKKLVEAIYGITITEVEA